MSTQQQTTSSQQQTAQQSGSSQGGFQNIYDPTSMSQFQAARGQALSGLQSWANNPMQNSFFNTLAQMQRGNIGQQGQSAMQGLLQNAQTSGMSGSSPYMQSLMAQQGRAQSGQQAQGFNALLSQMPQYQLQALGALQGGFNPLQTGGSQQQSYTGQQSGQQTGQQTQQMSGLGTWLPQLLGGGLGALTGGLMGKGNSGGSNPFAGGSPMYPSGPSLPTGSMGSSNPFMGMPSPGSLGSFTPGVG